MTVEINENISDFEDEKIEQIREGLAASEAPDNSDLTGLLAELGDVDDATVNIYREAARGRKNAFLFSCAPDDYNFGEIQERLRDEYEGGNFVVHVRAKGKWVTKRSFAVEPPKKDKSAESTSTMQNDLAAVMLTMRESQQASIDQMREMMAHQAESQQNILIELIRSQGNAPQNTPPQMTPLDMVTMITQLKALDPPPQQEDTMSTFLKGLEFGKDINEGGNDSVLQTALKTFGQPLVDMSKGLQIPTQVQPQAQPQTTQAQPVHDAKLPPLPDTGAQADQTPTKSDDEMNLFLLNKLRPIIEMMARGAQLDGDHDVYANLLLDQAGIDVLNRFIIPVDEYNKLFTLAPQLNPFKPWFDAVRELALLYISQEAEENEADNVPIQPEATTINERGESTSDNESNISPITPDA